MRRDAFADVFSLELDELQPDDAYALPAEPAGLSPSSTTPR